MNSLLTETISHSDVIVASLSLLCAFILGILCGMGETAIASLSEARIKALIETNTDRSAQASVILAQRSALLLRMRTGRFLFRSIALVIAVHFGYILYGSTGLWTGFFAIYLLQSFLSEIGAATMRRLPADRMIRWVHRLKPLGFVTLPLAKATQRAIDIVQEWLPIAPSEHANKLTEFEVEHVIQQGQEAGAIPQEEAQLLKSVLDFRDTIVREVMVPRTKVVAIAADTHLDRVLQIFVKEGHSRYPVYRDRIDHIEGVLYAKDLLKAVNELESESLVWTSLVRKSPFFVAESQKVSEVLREMQVRRVHLAIVVDEFGGTNGIVTLEDILEELVGEIRDEHDQEEPAIQSVGDQKFVVQAEASVHEIQDSLGIVLTTPQSDYESLAGYIVHQLGHVPKAGERIEQQAMTLTVLEADERRIKKVEIHLSTPPPNASSSPPIRQSDAPSSL